MLPAERQNIILEEVSQHAAVSIKRLTERLGVSRETVRKDIEELAEKNKLQQVRGGATRIQTREPAAGVRSTTNVAGKTRMAEFLVQQIPDGASVILDSGSTTRAVAAALARHRHDLRICTNDIEIMDLIAPVATSVTLLGGVYDPSERATFGLETIENLGRYRAEFALVSAGGLSGHALFTDFSPDVSRLRSQMLRQAERAFILADKSKFGVVGQSVLKPLPEQVTLVTDRDPPDEIADALKANAIDSVAAL